MVLNEKNYASGNAALAKRFEWTCAFVKTHVPGGGKILDLGVPNPMSKKLIERGYLVENAFSDDLDFGCDAVKQKGFDVFTSFEVFEHMVNPLPLLQDIEAPVLIASVPELHKGDPLQSRGCSNGLGCIDCPYWSAL